MNTKQELLRWVGITITETEAKAGTEDLAEEAEAEEAEETTTMETVIEQEKESTSLPLSTQRMLTNVTHLTQLKRD